MRFSFDHDLHLHSNLSSCSHDPEQTSERILQYAIENKLKTICLANHFWDEDIDGASPWYVKQNFSHISAAKPLPQDRDVKFLFGCEIELDRNMTLALSPEKYDEFDFIVIPTTHFHMVINLFDEQKKSANTLAQAWIDKFDAVMNMDLPFYKVGLAHLTCDLMARHGFSLKEILDAIPENELKRLFTKASALGIGIEINADDFKDEENITDSLLNVYKIAKDCGCKFYFGSDAHSVAELNEAKTHLTKAVDLLDLKESDKFDFSKL